MAMASSNISTPQMSSSTPTHPQTPKLRSPLPLSSAQEAQVKDLYYKKVRSKCAEEIKEFALCAKGRTVTTSWTCRAQRFAMNSCMILHATQENEDLAREEWFAGIQDRRRKKEEDYEATEKRRVEVIEMTKRQEEKEQKIKEEEERRKKAELEASGKKSKGWWG